MKNSIIISLAALCSFAVAAQEPCLSLVSKIPPCVLSCAQEAAFSVGCTNTADLKCQCNPRSSRTIQSIAAGCALGACSATEIPEGINAGSSLCACAVSHLATAAATTSESGSETSGTATETSGTGTTSHSKMTGTRTGEITRTGTLSGRSTSTSASKTTTSSTKTTATATTPTTTGGAGLLHISLAGLAGALLVAVAAL